MRNPYKLSLARYSTHNIVSETIGKNNRVLDVGCNDGYIGQIADKSNIFYGLDYLPKSIKKTKKIYQAAIVYDLHDLKPLPWKVKFNIILFADVLEHVLDPEKILSFFVDKYLDKNGIVVISLPNIANWQVRLRLLFGQFNYTETGILDKTHLHFYTFKSAKELVEKCGLKTIKTQSGSSMFGYVINFLPFLRYVLATNIILINEN